MKRILVLFLAGFLGSVARAQPIPLSELVGADRALRDPLYGVAGVYPENWEVRTAMRWGKNNKENTIFFQPRWLMQSRPSLYYQPTSNFDKPAAGQEEAHFRYTAGTKAASRVASGRYDYKNLENTFTFTQINGRPAFRYLASFTVNGKPHYEYFTRILGEQMMVMFFMTGPLEELETLRREVDQMSATMQVP